MGNVIKSGASAKQYGTSTAKKITPSLGKSSSVVKGTGGSSGSFKRDIPIGGPEHQDAMVGFKRTFNIGNGKGYGKRTM